jgi:2-(3-amino-3-carboxypropyl)histidine synthase
MRRKTTSFDLEEKRLKKEISKRKTKIVLLQLPEGLKTEGPRLAAIIEEAGALTIVSADPCYGACDLALPDAESLGATLIVHYGHSPQSERERVPTVYMEARAKTSVKETIEKAISLLESWSSIGLATTVQHVHKLDKAKTLLVKAGKTVAIGDAGLVKYPGQVIGCNFSNAQSVSEEVEAFLFIGGGRFHAIGVALTTAKPTIIADPYEKRAYPIHNEVHRILKQRWASISEAKGTENFGVLIGLKSGQKRIKDAERIKEKLQKSGRKATLLVLREITPKALMQFPNIDAFVNTACPRLSLDDNSTFPKPILSLNEVHVMLGEMDWEELCRKGWFENST